MQTQTPRHRIQQLRVGYRNGDDVGDVELEEEKVVEDAVDVGVADEDEDEEWQRDKIQHHCDNGRVASSLGASHRGRRGLAFVDAGRACEFGAAS